MNSFDKYSSEIHPENTSELQLYAKKWKISFDELCRAIVETGTTNTKELRDHIRKGRTDNGQLSVVRMISRHLNFIRRS